MEHRIAALDKDNCFSKKCHTECIAFCPVNKDGSECIILGSDNKAVISEPLCTGCGICVNKCPFEAITIVNMAHELGFDKIHQYDINSFRLYRLPIPIPGKIIGLVGKNGVGKTTALNILSGTLKPNLGNYENSSSWNDIFDHFHGNELKKYFQKLSENKLNVSIKPQAVYKLKDYWRNSGLELLEKVSTLNNIENLINDLNLDKCVNKPVSELSGGELQRLSIAVTSTKDADVYFFDEPSSYNDVFQRLSVSKVIQKLADKGKSVILVEHDITFLDYLSDYIHIIYGESGAYGIVSSSLPSRTGINVLIDGYLPNENIQFRDSKIKFNVYSPEEFENQNSIILKYDSFSKTFDNFKLNVSEGEIKLGQILGVIGGNSLGKTTFMKILAGLEKSDNNNINSTVKISYKPQYLNSNSNDNVKTLLYNLNSIRMEDKIFNSEIIRPLSIHKILEKDIKKLSGGELQKVAIVICLLNDADIYALDEPSAFIDIEDRIVFAKSIQKFVKSNNKSAIIIDHDIQLIDIICDSLLLFTGINGVKGIANSPSGKLKSMNKFLQNLQMTYRRDPQSHRPRVNKIGSRLDKEQKNSGMYYYLSQNE